MANCRDLQDCSSCLQVSECQWCNDTCISNKTCLGNSITNTLECPQSTCLATDCVRCHQLNGCTWHENDNTCLTGSGYNLLFRIPQITFEILVPTDGKTEIATCNITCAHFNSCSTCLNDNIDCRWSTQLNECFEPSYTPMFCAGGVCGLVLKPNEKQYCPEPCESFNQCSTCLKHFHCGWCSIPGSNGQGICTDGSNDRPLSGTCEQVFADKKNVIVTLFVI